MANPEVRARLKPKARARHERLKETFGLKNTFSADRETIEKAEELAEKHLKLKERLKDLFGNLI